MLPIDKLRHKIMSPSTYRKWSRKEEEILNEIIRFPNSIDFTWQNLKFQKLVESRSPGATTHPQTHSSTSSTVTNKLIDLTLLSSALERSMTQFRAANLLADQRFSEETDKQVEDSSAQMGGKLQ